MLTNTYHVLSLIVTLTKDNVILSEHRVILQYIPHPVVSVEGGGHPTNPVRIIGSPHLPPREAFPSRQSIMVPSGSLILM